MKAPLKLLVLFSAGMVLSSVIHMLHLELHITESPDATLQSIFVAPKWVALTCGTAAVLIGLLFPQVDRIFGVRPQFDQDWANVIRCIVGFCGIAYASAKFSFENNAEMSCFLAAFAIWLWYLSDRTGTGFALGLFVAAIGTAVVQVLVYNGVYSYTKPDFFFVRSWLPCVLFAAGVAFGNLGRQLAV
eukprot:m.244824 g.244824  ORF g.244824 m.244824 type:complete len:188 (-) comp14538_c0_seq1:247-810(-)